MEKYTEEQKTNYMIENIRSYIEDITMGPLGAVIKDETEDLSFSECFDKEYAYQDDYMTLVYKTKGVKDRDFKEDKTHLMIIDGKKYTPAKIAMLVGRDNKAVENILVPLTNVFLDSFTKKKAMYDAEKQNTK